MENSNKRTEAQILQDLGYNIPDENYAELLRLEREADDAAANELSMQEVYEKSSPYFSEYNVEQALDYAQGAVVIPPEEVGKLVYDKLIAEKVLEFLNK